MILIIPECWNDKALAHFVKIKLNINAVISKKNDKYRVIKTLKESYNDITMIGVIDKDHDHEKVLMSFKGIHSKDNVATYVQANNPQNKLIVVEDNLEHWLFNAAKICKADLPKTVNSVSSLKEYFHGSNPRQSESRVRDFLFELERKQSKHLVSYINLFSELV